MKLLITTQAVDENDLYLGFFHNWISELAKHFEQVTVICLRKGEYTLPPNVRVFALGGSGRLLRAYKLLKGAYKFRSNYDAVFVHMNEEYPLVAGWLWKLLGKPVYLWRNHYSGSWLTDIAASFCTKVFYTSAHSYTTKYKKAVLMPVGVDTLRYSPAAGVERKSRSVLFYARMSKSKRPDVLLEALGELHQEGVGFFADFYGTPLPQEQKYLDGLKHRAQELGLADTVSFYPGQPPADGPAIFSAHEIFVNLGASGMYDKMLFEAAACGCVVLAASEDWRALVGEEYYFTDTAELVDKLKAHLGERAGSSHARLTRVVKDHTLDTLAARLKAELTL